MIVELFGTSTKHCGVAICAKTFFLEIMAAHLFIDRKKGLFNFQSFVLLAT